MLDRAPSSSARSAANSSRSAFSPLEVRRSASAIPPRRGRARLRERRGSPRSRPAPRPRAGRRRCRSLPTACAGSSTTCGSTSGFGTQSSSPRPCGLVLDGLPRLPRRPVHAPLREGDRELARVVQHHAARRQPVPFQERRAARGDPMPGLPRTGDHDDPVRHREERHHITRHDERRAVQDHDVGDLLQPFDEPPHGGRSPAARSVGRWRCRSAARRPEGSSTASGTEPPSTSPRRDPSIGAHP